MGFLKKGISIFNFKNVEISKFFLISSSPNFQFFFQISRFFQISKFFRITKLPLYLNYHFFKLKLLFPYYRFVFLNFFLSEMIYSKSINSLFIKSEKIHKSLEKYFSFLTLFQNRDLIITKVKY